jgi:Zn-dependent protease with chaperone function
MVTEQLRSVVPGWVEWFGPLLFLLGIAAVVGLIPIVAVGAAARGIDRTDHWTQQARFVHAARLSVVVAAVAAPAGVLALSNITVGPLARVPEWLVAGAGVVVAVFAVTRTSWWLEGSVLDQPLPGFARFLLGFLVRLTPAAVILLLGFAAPASLSSPWMITLILLAVGVALALRFQLDLLTAFGLAWPADEELTSLIGRAASQVGLAPPRVFLIDHHQPNAFAFPWRGTVAFTTRAVAELSEDELESVAFHELGHLSESGAASLLRQAVHFIWIPVVAIKPILGSSGTSGLLVLVVVLGGIVLALRRFGSAMETRSDSHAITNAEASGAYGRALEKVYRIGLIPAVLRRPSHGQLHERLEAAGLTADFDPPAPPPIRVLAASTMAAVLVGLGIGVAPYMVTIGADLSSPTPAHVALSLGTYGSWPFERLGQLADGERDYETAEVFFAAAAEATTDPDPLIDLVYVRSVLGRCADAEAALTSLMESTALADDLTLAGQWVDWCQDQSGDSF